MNKVGDNDFNCIPPKSNANQEEEFEGGLTLSEGTLVEEGWAFGVVGEFWLIVAEFNLGVDNDFLVGSKMAIADDCWPRWAKAWALALWWGLEEALVDYTT